LEVPKENLKNLIEIFLNGSLVNSAFQVERDAASRETNFIECDCDRATRMLFFVWVLCESVAVSLAIGPELEIDRSVF
jgi:hypothetical protein